MKKNEDVEFRKMLLEFGEAHNQLEGRVDALQNAFTIFVKRICGNSKEDGKKSS